MDIRRTYWVRPGWHVAICTGCSAAEGFKTYKDCFTYGYRHFTEYQHRMNMFIGINNPLIEIKDERPYVHPVTERNRRILGDGGDDEPAA